MVAETISLFNTLSRKLEPFQPLKSGQASLYTCGPTVYHFAHIGNLRSNVFEDVLRRTLTAAGYAVTHVMNITDVGHLESDADAGNDKMMIAMRRENKSPWEIAAFYEKAFFEDAARLHVLRPTIVCRATDHIQEMIDFVQDLQTKGFAYVVDGNVYFDIAKFPAYPDFAQLQLHAQEETERVTFDLRKRNPQDFVLWFSESKYPNQIMKWPSPWGVGFPGWHIECSAMASKYLGERIDIHCGGIDHIPVHHTNEIAQSEAHFGHRWVNYWLHNEFLHLDKGKMSKSKGEMITLQTLIDAGYSALSYRYLLLTTHYRSPLLFSYESLEGAKRTLANLRGRVIEWRQAVEAGGHPAGDPSRLQVYRDEFRTALHTDLNTAVGLSVLWQSVKDDGLSPQEHLTLLEEFDQILGLGVSDFQRRALTPEQAALIERRLIARRQKNWTASDAIRDELAAQGVLLKDRADGTDWVLTEG